MGKQSDSFGQDIFDSLIAELIVPGYLLVLSIYLFINKISLEVVCLAGKENILNDLYTIDYI